MKKYSDLTSLQKDFAVDKALKVLAKKLVDTEFDYCFKSPIAQRDFNYALLVDPVYFQNIPPPHRIRAIDVIMNSDEIAEELYPIAESMAEVAYYPNGDEVVIEGIAS